VTVAQPDQIDIIVADLDLYTRGEITALAVNLDANLRDSPPIGTPVDTGWARANWVPTLGTPYEPAGMPKDPSPSQITARAQEQAAGLNDVLSWRGDEDGPIFITNNVPYIGALNAGHSTQSPLGFVQDAMEKAVRETYSAGATKAQRFRRADAARAAKPRPKP
jgi:hypothetical protein